MVQKRRNLLDDIQKQMSQMMRHHHEDIYIEANGIMRLIDEASVTGNNRKYLELYNKIAPLYRISNAIYFLLKFGGEKRYRNEFLTELEINPGDKLLETSVGAGDNFRYMPKDVRLYGLDLSYGMLKQAVKNTKKWKRQAYYFQGECGSFTFQSELF